ncbi:hypothetical protein ANCCAN_10107 [Ancylostoma caninum]|uniref:Uncharacterized protein n=1 Tax=Ancylostoma caninum TaxID=29170 RepID=A0A368GHQ9_ANCCA|nr:hypothetical protein ANCCAN_10107 [Ancylostoma caninum]
MAEHYRQKIENHHKDLRGGGEGPKYDCKLEVEARRKQDNPSYKIPKGLGMIRIKLPKDNGKTTVRNLEEAFKSVKETGNERKLLQMTSPQVTRYGCWGKFYHQIYDELSVVCVYDPKRVLCS